MKRLFVILIFAIFASLATASLRVVHSSTNLSITTSTAMAAACGKDEVQVALKFKSTDKTNCIKNDPKTGGVLVYYIKGIISVLSGLIGGIIVLMLIIAGFQYIISRGDAANIKKAKDRIQNAIIALILFLSAYAILSFLLPGTFTS